MDNGYLTREEAEARTRADNESLGTLLILGLLIVAAIFFFLNAVVQLPKAEGAKLTSARTVLAAPNGTAVPLLTSGNDRTSVGMTIYLPNGVSAIDGSGVFATYDLLIPGQAVVEDEYKLAIPHIVELRLFNPANMDYQNILLAEIWDADGDGNGDYLAIAFFKEGVFTHWKVFRIVGTKPAMREVDLKMFLELYPDPNQPDA